MGEANDAVQVASEVEYVCDLDTVSKLSDAWVEYVLPAVGPDLTIRSKNQATFESWHREL